MKAYALVLGLGIAVAACGGGEDSATCMDRCDGDNITYCDDSGAETSASCPALDGSTCDDSTGAPACSCGSVSAGGVCYSGAGDDVDLMVCENGALAFYSCPSGTACGADASGAYCYCDNAADGICPDAACTDDADCASCTPSCAGRECGDNGCGGTCSPGCALGESCGADGHCGGGGPASPWTKMTSSTTANLRSISGVPALGSSPRRVIAVGDNGTVLQLQQPASWATFPTTGTSGVNLRAVSVEFPDLLAVVGQGGKAFLYDGIPAGWREVSTGVTADLDAVHQRANDTYMFGSDAYRFATGDMPPTIQDVYNGPSVKLHGSDGFQNSSMEDDVWAVGDNGVILRWESVTSSFLPETSGTSANLNAVFVAHGSGTSVFAVGAGGVILESSGDGTWSTETSCTTADLYGVFGDLAANEVYAVGAGGAICKRTGGTWSAEASGTTVALRGGLILFETTAQRYIVGDGGTILTK